MPAALVVLLLAIAQQPAAPRDVTSPSNHAAITGRVTERGSGRPLPRIVVTLTRTGRTTPLHSITDDEGRYEFTGIEPGEYALSAGPDRHRSTYLHQRYGSDTPGLTELEPTRPNLTVTAGERRSGVDIALWRALAIEGRVIDPSEHGMANVTVVVMRAAERGRRVTSAMTDDRGMYRAYGLAPGRYRVCAQATERSDAVTDGVRLGSTCYPAAVDQAAAAEIALTAQDAVGIDIRVQQFRTYSIAGSVVGANGSPVHGARVGAYPIGVNTDGSPASGTTRNGEFALKGLAAGRYMVRAALTEPNPGDGYPERDVEVGYASVDLIAGDVGGVTVSLSKPVDVSGRVTFEGARPPSSRAVRMVVHAGPGGERVAYFTFEGRPPFSAVADDLSFELKRLYRFPTIVRITGLPDGWALKSVLYNGRDITYVPTEFGSGPTPGRLELILTNRVAQPTLRVVDHEGKTITSCHLIMMPADPATWRTGGGLVPVTREPDGLMKLASMLPGEYIVAAVPLHEGPSLLEDPARIDSIAPIGTRETLTAGDRRTFDVRLVNLPAKQ
jgi:protocatechuate 3,4-dioxygenase beta subunit